MKSLILALALFAATAQAHVLLTTPYAVTGSGASACSAPHITATGYSWQRDISGSAAVMSITYAYGTATFSGGIDSAFVIAGCAPTLTNSLNMTTGVWILTSTTSSGGVSQIGTGTLSGANLTGALAAFTGGQTALYDFADYFLTLSGGSFLPTALGTQPDVWGSGDQ